jgi:hypothetical protein
MRFGITLKETNGKQNVKISSVLVLKFVDIWVLLKPYLFDYDYLFYVFIIALCATKVVDISNQTKTTKG